ncbi:hypothetical protein RB195_001712 [Necator americanus]|uniref:Uncharacterized protein n=1 Tax=Necator americanus TaxID=51031 RepID=A0ABR1DG60_NECAM
MRKLEWDDMGVKIDGGTNADRIRRNMWVHWSSAESTKEDVYAERMDLGCPIHAHRTNIFECTSYVYLGRELNMMNDLTPELGRRRRTAWEAYKSIEDVVKKTKNTRLRAHLFNTTVLPALTYASETLAFRKHEKNATLRVGIRSRNSLVSLAELYLKTEKNSDEYDGVPAKFVRPLDHLLQSGWTSNRLNSSMSSVTWAEC